MSAGVNSSVTFSVSVKSDSLLLCGPSRDRVDIACITASAMRGMSASVKLGAGPVEWALLLLGRLVVELLRARFPGHPLAPLFGPPAWLRTLAPRPLIPRPLVPRRLWAVMSTSSRGCSTLLELRPLVPPRAPVVPATRPLL